MKVFRNCQVIAESIGFEPMGQLLDHSLANCSFNHSGNSPLTLKYNIVPTIIRLKE